MNITSESMDNANQSSNHISLYISLSSYILYLYGFMLLLVRLIGLTEYQTKGSLRSNVI